MISFSWSFAHAAINFTITPIKYELELQPGESITLPASIRNNGDTSVTLPTTASDFQANGTSGIPSIVRKSELVYPDQQLSSWITISDSSVTLEPGEEKSVDFTIDVPQTASPGWHYGAVLFKNDNSETSTSWNIWINVDYGIIILVNVDGDIIVDVDIAEPIIGGSGIVRYDRCDGPDTSGSIYDGKCKKDPQNTEDNTGWNNSGTGNPVSNEDSQVNSSNENNNSSFNQDVVKSNPNLIPWYIWKDENGDPIYEFPDDCPFGDFTPSRYDNSCMQFISPISKGNSVKDELGNNIWNSWAETKNREDFDISFSFPIKNKGNTHVKPTGKIILQDEYWKALKAIGKENITNDAWAIIWEKIVDYIPVNESQWNVLPYSQRIFESEWKWFPYKDFDQTGEPVIKYWSPSEYYTRKNQKEAGFLMFWERVSEVRTHKKITALIEMSYKDAEGNPVEFNTAQEFPVQYIEQRVTVNPYIILWLLLIASIILMTWFGIRWWFLVAKRHKCWKCKKVIKSHWETCPYCKAVQDKKKHKKLEKLMQEEKTEAPKKRRGRPRKNTESSKK